MKQYRAIKVENTYQLIPISKEAIFSMGYYDVASKKLILQSYEAYEDYQFVAKIDEFGKQMFKKDKSQPEGKGLVERRLVKFNYKYKLETEDKDWFLEEFVVNPELCSFTELSAIASSQIEEKELAEEIV